MQSLYMLEANGFLDEFMEVNSQEFSNLGNPYLFGSANMPKIFPFLATQNAYTAWDEDANYSFNNDQSEPAGLPGAGIDVWAANGAVLTANGPVGWSNPSLVRKIGRGRWYAEVEITSAGPVQLGVVGLRASKAADLQRYQNPATDSYPLAAVYDTGLGKVYANGAEVAGTWATLTTGDRLGILLDFHNPDGVLLPDIFESQTGTFETRVFFYKNGAIQNSGNVGTGAGKVVVADSTEFSRQWRLIARVARYLMAQATVVVDAASLVAGDYLEVGGDVLGFERIYEARIEVRAATGMTGRDIDITVDPGGGGEVTYTITGAAAESIGADEWDGEAASRLDVATSITAVINDAGQPWNGVFSAALDTSGTYPQVRVRTTAPYTAARSIAVASAGSVSITPVAMGPLTATTDDDLIQELVGWLNNLSLSDTQSPFRRDTIRALGYIGSDGLRLFHKLNGAAGNGDTVTTNNAGAFVVTAFAGGVANPVVTLFSDPADWTGEPGISETGWIYANSENFSAVFRPLVFGLLGSPANFDVQDAGNLLAEPCRGRSIKITTSNDYNGGNVELTIWRADTKTTVVRTVTIVPGTPALVSIPVEKILRCRNLGGSFTTGSLIVGQGDFWMPPGIPASSSGGVVSPSPLSTLTAHKPRVILIDDNNGQYEEVLTGAIGGEDNNMLDLTVLTRDVNGPAQETRITGVRCFALVTYVP